MDRRNHPAGESIADLLRQARRAQEIIAAIDFQKIAGHDAEEVHKLPGVSDALEKLAQGEDVDRVDGIDEVTNTDPRQAWIADLMQILDAAGYSDRVDRVCASGNATDRSRWKPLALVPHREGLPLHDLCLAPDDAPAQGAHGLFISATGVYSAHVPQPFSRHTWKILRSQRYDSEAELLAIVARYLNPTDS